MHLKTIITLVSCLVLMEIARTKSFQIRYAHIQVIRKHPKLRKCAATVLQRNEYFGGRLSESDGKCEGLSRNFGFNQTVESGDGYFKKISIKDEFAPPMSNTEFYMFWVIPFEFSAGAKIDFNFRTPAKPWSRIEINVLGPRERYGASVLMDSDTGIHILQFGQYYTSDILTESNKTYKVTFLAEENAFKVYLNGDEKGETPIDFPLSTIGYIELLNHNRAAHDIYSLEFSAA